MTLVPPPSWRFNQHCRRFPSHASSSPAVHPRVALGVRATLRAALRGRAREVRGERTPPVIDHLAAQLEARDGAALGGADAPASVEDEDDDATGEGGDPGGGAAGDPGGGGAVAARDSTPAVAEP